VMITASHLPYNRNGFKFFTSEGGFEKGDITQLLSLAAVEHAAEDAPNSRPGGRYMDDAFVLSAALHTEPGLIEYVRPHSGIDQSKRTRPYLAFMILEHRRVSYCQC